MKASREMTTTVMVRNRGRARSDRISLRGLKYDSIKVGFTASRNGYEPVNVDRALARARGFFPHVCTYTRSIPLGFTSNGGPPRLSRSSLLERAQRCLLLVDRLGRRREDGFFAVAPSVLVSSLYRFRVLFFFSRRPRRLLFNQPSRPIS